MNRFQPFRRLFPRRRPAAIQATSAAALQPPCSAGQIRRGAAIGRGRVVPSHAAPAGGPGRRDGRNGPGAPRPSPREIGAAIKGRRGGGCGSWRLPAGARGAACAVRGSLCEWGQGAGWDRIVRAARSARGGGRLGVGFARCFRLWLTSRPLSLFPCPRKGSSEARWARCSLGRVLLEMLLSAAVWRVFFFPPFFKGLWG